MSADLELAVKARDDASSTLSKIKGHLGDVAKIAGGFVVAQGIEKLGGFLFDAAKGAAEDAQSVDRLKQAYKNANGDLGDFTDWMDDYVKHGQKMAFSDDQVRDSLSILTAQTGSATEAGERHILALDLARGANIDVVAASKLLGKVTDENVGVLKKMGITIKDGAKEADVFAAVQSKFGGQAATYAKSTAGQFEIAKIRMSELKETIGYAVLPIMTKLIDFVVTTGIPALEKLADQAIPKIKKAFEDAKPTIESIQETITKVVAFIKEHWNTVTDIFQLVWDNVKTKIEGMIEVIRGVIDLVTHVVDGIDDLIHGRWSDAWNNFKQIPSDVVDILIGYVKTQFGNLPELLLDLAGKAGDAIKNGIEGGIKGVEGLIKGYVNAWIDVFNGFIGLLSGREISPHVNSPFGLPDIPSLNMPTLPRIPHYANGGYVPTPTLAVIGDTPGGEWVLNRSQMAAMGGGITMNFAGATIYGYADFKSKVGQAVRDIHNAGGGIR